MNKLNIVFVLLMVMSGVAAVAGDDPKACVQRVPEEEALTIAMDACTTRAKVLCAEAGLVAPSPEWGDCITQRADVECIDKLFPYISSNLACP